MPGRSKKRNKRKKAEVESDDETDFMKSTIKVPKYSGNYEPVQKVLYRKANKLQTHSEQEIEEYRQKNHIYIGGENCPGPFIEFTDYKLPAPILAEIKKQQFTAPTPIQAQSWPICLSGRDFIGIARTGSGKTLSFILPAILHIQEQPPLENGDGPIALVLSPTRELAHQTNEVAKPFAICCKLRTTCVYGGGGKDQQKRELAKGAEICIATPGRMIELISAGHTNLNRCSFLCLDEADRMLEMGFESQIKLLIQGTRRDRHTLMFSATWPPEVQELVKEYMKKPVKVRIGSLGLSANHNITQMIDVCSNFEKKERMAILMKKIAPSKFNKVLIFVRTKHCVEELVKVLDEAGFKSLEMHGDKSQMERTAALKEFRTGENCILVATDVAARGLDVNDISVVVNYDYPNLTADYVHRIGRTARSTNQGSAYTFFTTKDAKHADDLIQVLREAQQNIPQGLYTMSRRAKNRSVAVGRFRNSGIFAQKQKSAKERQKEKDQRVDRIREAEAKKKLNTNFFDVFN